MERAIWYLSGYRLNSAFQLFEEEIYILVWSESLVLCKIVLILMRTLIIKTGICACSSDTHFLNFFIVWKN